MGFVRRSLNVLTLASGLLVALFLGWPEASEAATYGDFTYEISGGKVEIAKYDCSGGRGNVVVPDFIGERPITTIMSYAFQNCTRLTRIVIPDSVRTIGDYAFSNCTSLGIVTLGNGLTRLGEQAFIGCPNLTNIVSLRRRP